MQIWESSYGEINELMFLQCLLVQRFDKLVIAYTRLENMMISSPSSVHRSAIHRKKLRLRAFQWCASFCGARLALKVIYVFSKKNHFSKNHFSLISQEGKAIDNKF
jgi:hypothetical protein